VTRTFWRMSTKGAVALVDGFVQELAHFRSNLQEHDVIWLSLCDEHSGDLNAARSEGCAWDAAAWVEDDGAHADDTAGCCRVLQKHRLNTAIGTWALVATAHEVCKERGWRGIGRRWRRGY
jgi:hypothetical protein